MSKPTEFPYQALGQKIRAARVRLKRTVAEASGAVEINEDVLKGIELGKQRPEEEVLMVLISYLGIAEDEATKLWEMGGYNQHEAEGNEAASEINQSLATIMPNDLRVIYTDMVHVMVNDFGVIMNFLQGGGPNNQPLAVARIGMSKEHARSVLDILSKSLEQSDKHNHKSKAKKPSAKKPPTPKDTESR